MRLRQARLPRDRGDDPAVGGSSRRAPRSQPSCPGAGRHLGTALAHLVSALNIDAVVLSGCDEVLGETFRAAARDAVRKRTLDDLGGAVDLRPSNFGDDDVLLGAAVLILDHELGVA